MIAILFGLPGAGKNFVAEAFRDNFGFYLYDADRVLPSAALNAIKKKRMVAETVRRAFYRKLAEKAKSLEKRYGKIVIPRTFTHERSRRYFKKAVPRARFILVKANRTVRDRRIAKRYHHIDLEYARQFEKIFEKPLIPHAIVINNRRGAKTLKRRIAKLLGKMSHS